MDAKDARIIEAVARLAPTTYRELMKYMGLQTVSTLQFRITGRNYQGAKHLGGGLLVRGWIAGCEKARTLRPGPRFAGLDHGWPLEIIE